MVRPLSGGHGEEGLPAPPHVINEGHEGTVIPLVSEENWKRKFARDWPRLRPHLIFENADPYHQHRENRPGICQGPTRKGRKESQTSCGLVTLSSIFMQVIAHLPWVIRKDYFFEHKPCPKDA